MEKLTNKIIETTIWSALLVIICVITYSYFTSLFTNDEEGMFIYGMTLMVLNSLTTLILVFSTIIASIWKTKKTKTKRNEKGGVV